MQECPPSFHPRKLVLALLSLLFLAGAAWGWLWVRDKPRRDELTRFSYSKQLFIGCLAYAKDHEERFPAALEELVQAKIIDASFYRRALELGTWDYRGKGRTTTDNRFLLMALHVSAKQGGTMRPYRIEMVSDGSIEITSKPMLWPKEP